MDMLASKSMETSSESAGARRARGLSRRAGSDGKRPGDLSPSQLRAIFEGALDAIFVTDGAGRYTAVNPAAAALLGLPVEELLGRSIADFGEPHFDFAGAWSGFLREGKARGEFRLVRPDGEVRDVEFAAVANIATDRHLSVIRDVSDIKRAEESLRQASLRKDEFLAMLAHELRNPLGAITSAVDLLKASDSHGPNFEFGRGVIERQAAHLTRLVDDLLDVSRITQGKIDLRRERVDLRAVLTLALELAGPHLEAREHEMNISIATEPLWVDGDLNRLAQAISSLLNNAAKFTPTGAGIWLAAFLDGEDAVVQVRDAGKGIPPDLLPQIFDIFVQEGGSDNRPLSGLGIGLTLVRTLVEMHGGRVTASSAGKGLGSEFVVRLPVRSPLETAAETPAARTSSSSRRVLVVDDSVDSAEGLSRLLQMSGHEVRTAYDGESALEAAAVFRPEVLFIDIGLPGMDGYELAKELRSKADFEGVLLVALTGYGQPDDRHRAREARFDHHMIKPVRVHALLEILSAAPDGSPALKR